jgi:CheY-like chemotaxis protein
MTATFTFNRPTRVLVAANGSARAVRRAVQAASGTVHEVAQPSDALKQAGRSSYAAILLDMALPGAFSVLRALSRLAPVVVLVEHESLGLKALLLGASAVISKKVRPQELIGTLARLGERELPLADTVRALWAKVDGACSRYCADSASPFPA